MKLWLKITLWVTGSIVGLLALILALAMWLLTSDSLTPLVNKYASQYLNADVNFRRVDVSIWSDFPQVSLSIIEGNIISKALAESDTLLKFKRLDLSLDAWGLIRMSGASVRSFALSGARARAIIDSTGRASWDILLPSESSAEDTTSMTFGFDISQIAITDSLSLYFRDDRDSSLIQAGFDSFAFRGVISDKLERVDIENFSIKNLVAKAALPRDQYELKTCVSQVSIAREPDNRGFALVLDSKSSAIQGSDTLANELPVMLHSVFDFDFKSDRLITLNQTTLALGSLEVGVDGTIGLMGDSTIASDLNVRIPTLALQDVVSYIPRKMRGDLSKISTDITLEFASRIEGSYNLRSGRLPYVTARISADKGFLRYQGLKARVDHFALDAQAIYNPDTIARSSIVVNKFELSGSGIDLRSSGSVVDILRDPLIEAKVDGVVDLTRLSLEFPSTRGMVVMGKLDMKSSVDTRLSNLNLAGMANAKISASLYFRDIYINSPLDSVEFTGHGRLSLGSNKNTRDSTLAQGLAILRARIVLDTLSLKYGSMIGVSGANLNVSARTESSHYAAKADRGAIAEFRGTVSSKRLQVIAPDSSLLRLNFPTIDFRVSPSKEDSHTPHLNLTIAARSVAARSVLSRYVMLAPKFIFDATIISKAQDSIKRAELRLDRLQKRYPQVARKDLLLYSRMMQNVGMEPKDDLASGDIDMTVSDEISSILRRWRSTGRIEMRTMRVVSPYMPLRTTVSGLDFSFNNDEISLLSSKFQVGRSDIKITGKVANLRRALSGRGNLVMRLAVSGDTLDLNQLIIASNAGLNAMPEMKELLNQDTSENEVAKIIEETTSAQQASQLVIIPKNIDLEIDLNVKRGYYGDVTMNDLKGALIAHDRILQINHLRAESSIGEIELNAVYATRSKTDITTGFDIVSRGVDVGELIDLIPAIDTMLPMLQSFEGQLDCKFAATASLDSTMSLMIPTLNAAGSISGRNMVLLDGKTFTEISKIMRFKNKSRNLVDKISVEMLVRNSAVELFPFVLELDRYKAAVSGVQKLDMSFDYHISVLKSIIPFRLGVDIFGNMDDWSFRITKARYKSENIPSYSALIDTTRIDLRRAITDIFTTGIKNLVLRETNVVTHVDSAQMAAIDSLAATTLDTTATVKVGAL